MTTWQPKFYDTTLIKNNKGQLLKKAAHLAKIRLKKQTLVPMEDRHGTYAFNTEDCIICAKKEPYGNIVSCHRADDNRQ